MGIVRINQLPEGSGSLSHDDVFLFMDDPSGSGVTKKISLNQISSSLGAISLPSSGLSITKTGDWSPINSSGPPVPSFTFTTPIATDIDGEFNRYDGKWILSFGYTEPSSSVSGIPRITSLSFNDLIGVTGAVTISAPFLSGIGLPTLSHCGNINITLSSSGVPLTIPNLITAGDFSSSSASVSLPSLKTLTGSLLGPLPALSAPLLKTIIGNISSANVGYSATLSLPSLVRIGGSFSLNILPSLTSISLPALSSVGANVAPSNIAATELSFPSLQYIGGSINPSNISALTTISLPSLIVCGGGISITNSVANLANFTLPTNGTLKNINGNINITSGALTQASIDNILEALSSLDGTNNTVIYGSGRTVTITGTSASPSNLGSTTTAGSNFVCSSTTCTVNWTNHGYTTGDVLRISGVTTATNANRYATINVVNANQFTYTTALTAGTLTGGGTATVIKANNSIKALVTRGVTLTTN